MAYPPPYGSGPPVAPARKTNGMALASLISGVVAWVALPLVGGVAAIVCGHIAQKQVRETGEEGAGLAVAGLVLGYLNLVASVLFVCVFGVAALGCLALIPTTGEVTPETPSPTELPTSPEPLPTE
jgi:hypothetical protein